MMESGLREGWIVREESRPPSEVRPLPPQPRSRSSLEVLREGPGRVTQYVDSSPLI